MINHQSKTITELTPSELYQQITKLETLIAEHEKRATEQQELLTIEYKRRLLAEALHRANVSLCSSLNYEEVLDRILEEVKEIIPHDAAAIMVIEGGMARTSRWRGYARFGAKGDIIPLSFNIATTPTLCSMQETGQPLVIPYVEQDEKWLQTSEERWIKSYLGAPIRIQNRLIGFLNLNSTIPGFFGQADVGPLEAFIEQVAIALQNAWLYDQGRQEVIERIRALKKERNFISTVLDTADALVMVLNRKGRIIRFNRACEQVTGYSFEEVRRKYWWDLFLPPEEVELFKADFEKLWLNQPPQRYESHWVTKDGRQRLIAWSNTVLYNYRGVAEYILNTGIDLTERKQAEEALRSSEERFQEVILSISDHVYVTEYTGDGYQLNRYISPHVEALTDYPQEKFIADWHFWPSQVIHPDDRAAAAAQAARLALGQNSEMEYRLVRANGDVIWVRDSVRVQSLDSSRIVYGVVSDITERKQAEEKLKATNQQLQVLTDRLQEELTLAQKIQQSLLPIGHPAWFGLDLECHTAPAREVGGDFYAYHVFEDDEATRRFAIAVGDVSGKGMPAALLMAASLTALHSVITRVSAPSKLLAELDLAIEPYTSTTLQNCALCYAEIIPLNSTLNNWSLRVANAGCITPLICRATGGIVEWVEVGGIPLGVGLGAQSGYAEAAFSLKPGDMVIFTSDGVVEATDGKGVLFGFERLEQAVVRGPKISAAAMLTHLRTEIAAFTASTELHDDLTIVVVQV